MTRVPDVLYAKSGDVSVAYQIVGDGPIDMVFVRGFTGDLLSGWDQPLPVRHIEGLARHTAGSDLAIEDAGEHELKGVPGRWRLFRVTG